MLSGTVFLMQVMLPGQYYQRVFAKSCWKSLRVLRTPKARPGAGCSSRFTERNCGEGFGEEAGNEWCAHWPYTLPLEAFKHAQSNNCPALIKTLATRLKALRSISSHGPEHPPLAAIAQERVMQDALRKKFFDGGSRVTKDTICARCFFAMSSLCLRFRLLVHAVHSLQLRSRFRAVSRAPHVLGGLPCCHVPDRLSAQGRQLGCRFGARLRTRLRVVSALRDEPLQ